MRTYRELFRSPEYTPLFAAVSAQSAAMTVSGLALGTLVYEVTRSPLASSLAMFGPSFAQLVGATTLLSAADRLPPRAALAGTGLLFAAVTALLAVPALPIWGLFALLAVLGLAGSVGGGVRYGLLTDILPKEGFILGRSVLNMSNGLMQIGGFAAGGVLVAFLSPRGTLLVGAGLYLVAALAARFGLAARPPRAAGRPSVAETWRGNARLWASPARRYVYVGLWVPNGLIVGCESLFVPYSPSHAGLLLAVSAVGMLTGDVLAGRFVPPEWRERIGPYMRLLLAAPYLVFAIDPALPVAAVAVTLASVGYCATLLLQERLMAVTPDDLQGQALGLHSSGMLAMQGVGATIAGGVAQVTGPAAAMAAVAALSVAVTLAIAPGLRPAIVPEPG
ncbi:MFS transporter [Actinomadura rupiterrae]|uniref:MFS transporter n=1 Tax=Actinomadura rupiterrae TaxID=559627 RepID=UPI0020A237C4|nr:MFS transporter [Actinomadura rupiterrae]MCP2336807.1 putative MFS family arabinose efflux permease [Actinomadura rupiterrae]